MGPRDSRIVSGSLESAQRHGLQHQLLDPDALARQHPEFAPPPDTWGLYEPNAGVLLPELCVAAQLDSAERNGAALRHGEAVRSWRAEGDRVIVNGVYEARSLILTTGPWIRELTGLPVEPHRVLLLHAEPFGDPSRFARIPLWLLDSAPGVFYYGVPYRAGEGAKLGLHRGADADEGDAARYLETLNRILPGAGGRLLWSEHCWYAMSPDCDFFVDRHPDYANVVFGGGFSGHGFKFAPVIGEALANLATRGHTELPIDFLSVRRIVESHKLEPGVDKQDVAGNAPSQIAG
jgi:sarcosine oxidase